ncbi:purine-uracil permease NCS1-like [Elaeis guineensis]|uniref:Purine-uracil permease NCS1-like n=1 Tax=Elaeis guineensis var. tenera TaxID=51953 RepID=A0A6I9RGZ5_ELAGV|nr:purine-uracil permease NCS1-like [Elaeis guineensis]
MTADTREPGSQAAGNRDLLPVPRSQRTFTAWDMAGLWVGLVTGVPSYYIAGSLVEEGMAWWQGISIVVAAKAVLLFPLLLAAAPGTRYGIPFPILARAAFGVRGAHVPALLRALVACGWFGIESWIGGQAFFLLLPSSLRSSSLSRPLPWLATSPLELACFLLFWLAQLAVVWRGMRGIRLLEKYSAPILVLLAGLLLAWAYVRAGGFGPMLSEPPRLTWPQFWALFFPSLTANVGSWAAVMLSISDFSRYARSQADQVLGQLGLPLFMGSFAFVGLAVTSATETIFGRLISDPIELLSQIGSTFAKILAIPGITLAILTTNIPANVVAPANALVSLSPSTFSFKSGALLTALIGIAFQPWRIYNSPDSFVYTWLVGYSAVMGPLAGILLTDYYVLRHAVLDVDELYSTIPDGVYYYRGGYNVVAMVTLVVSIVPIVPGFLHKLGMLESTPVPLIFIYNIGWFYGFFSSGLVYLALSRWKWLNGGSSRTAASSSSSSHSLMDGLLGDVKN